MKVSIYTLLFLFNLLAGTSAFSQESKFIFFQNESRQPFYLSMNGKIYSSSASGYLILSKLQEGDYQFKIGFANDVFPEQPFLLNVQKDMGFSLKNFGEKGWGLFNHQSMAVVMAGEPVKKDVALVTKSVEEEPITFKSVEKKEIVSAAVTSAQPATEAVTTAQVERAPAATDTAESVTTNKEDEVRKAKEVVPQNVDSAKQAVASVATGDPDTAAVVVKAEARTAQNEMVLPVTEDGETASEKRAARKARKESVRKVNEKSTKAGVSLTYLDKDGKITDTIQVVIPSEEVANESSTARAEVKQTEEKALASQQATNSEMASAERPVQNVASTTATASTAKSSCKEVASDNDYAKVRRRMAQETSDE